MRIADYFYQIPRHERSKLKAKMAEYVGVHVSSIQHWINETRKPTPLHALKLEKFTNGVVSRYDERPDIYLHE